MLRVLRENLSGVVIHKLSPESRERAQFYSSSSVFLSREKKDNSLRNRRAVWIKLKRMGVGWRKLWERVNSRVLNYTKQLGRDPI